MHKTIVAKEYEKGLTELLEEINADAEHPEGTEPAAYVDIVFDGPPSHESGRFVEVESPEGVSIRHGQWIDRGDGFWALRIPQTRTPEPRYEHGEEVLVHGMPGTVCFVHPVCQRYTVEHDVGGVSVQSVWDEDSLDPAPEALPKDHLDRFWIPGAVLENDDPAYQDVLVIVRDEFRSILEERETHKTVHYYRPTLETGWRFHASSPVKQPKEPEHA